MESIKPDIQCLVFVGASLEAVEKTKHWIYLRGVGGKKDHFGIILSFLVVPETKILVSKEGAAGCSSLVGKIPLIAGIRTHGRKPSAGNDTTLLKINGCVSTQKKSPTFNFREKKKGAFNAPL